ncbi:hypothetical protein [Methylobacterium sp. R2-1]|uniref:hypothetical protein n=1 Tax=Methylobacterium sp. R2-1 TaxID=2587064 RepID=UPI001617C427|nr:hypothetical protein [Methylobacterium sp. R2-1]MBB2964517.1 hypothetical protein [Methylobacterium sp. R2-1]
MTEALLLDILDAAAMTAMVRQRRTPGNSPDTESAFPRGLADASHADVFRLMPVVLPDARSNDDAFLAVDAWAKLIPSRQFAGLCGQFTLSVRSIRRGWRIEQTAA